MCSYLIDDDHVGKKAKDVKKCAIKRKKNFKSINNNKTSQRELY